MTSETPFSTKILEELARILNAMDLHEIEYNKGDVKLRVVKHTQPTTNTITHAAPTPMVPPAALVQNTPTAVPPSTAPQDTEASGTIITAPMIGTAYLAPEPQAPPFVKKGDAVEKGQTLLVVETMKVMNPIRSPEDGIIEEVLVNNAQPVEFGEPLVRLKA